MIHLHRICSVGVGECIIADAVGKVRAQINRRIQELVELAFCQRRRLIHDMIECVAVVRIPCIKKILQPPGESVAVRVRDIVLLAELLDGCLRVLRYILDTRRYMRPVKAVVHTEQNNLRIVRPCH